jgi:phage-related protein
MSDFSYVPSYSSQLKKKPRVFKAQFGDGYAQRTADGINANPQVWTLVWENITQATAAAIEALLDSYGGHTPFTWTPPGRSEIKVVCEEYGVRYDGFDQRNFSATFEQDFAP